MAKSEDRDFWDKFWKDKHGHFVVWQTPNPALWVWIASIVITFILPDGAVADVVGWIGKIAILIWAALELIWGASYFRRLLGLAVLLLPVAVILY
jgi:hypothetical protein